MLSGKNSRRENEVRPGGVVLILALCSWRQSPLAIPSPVALGKPLREGSGPCVSGVGICRSRVARRFTPRGLKSKGSPVFALAVFLAGGFASSPVAAQFGEAKGNLYGTVVDEQGGALPAVSVMLSGQGAPRTETTDARGQFRFLNLSPGTYAVKLELAGFASVLRENVVVSLGRNTEFTETMKVSSVAEAVTVTSETPSR